MSRSGTKICGVCQCTFGDGDCVHFEGQGTTDDPYEPEVIVVDDDDNLVECGPAGLAAFLEPVYLNPPACHLYGVIAEDAIVPWDIVWPLIFSEKRYDTDSMHDVENHPARITFNTPGLYLVTFGVRWNKTNDSTATGDYAIFIRKNGAELLGIDSFPVPGGDSYAKQSLSVEMAFEAGDYVDALVKQDIVEDDEPQTVQVTIERMSPVFSAMFIRPIAGMNILGVPSSSPSVDEGGGGTPGTQFNLNGGQYWSTPDHASLDITGDIDIRFAAAAVDWTPASSVTIVSKFPNALGQRSYVIQVPVLTDAFKLGISSTGSDDVSTTSISHGAVDGALVCFRAVLDVDNGAAGKDWKFYTKSATAATALTACSSDSGWVQLGTTTTQAGTTSIFSSSTDVMVGAQNPAAPSNFFTGDIYAVVIKNGINGTTVANPDFYHNNSPFTDGSGRTWTKI